jgi:hypothetical protein
VYEAKARSDEKDVMGGFLFDFWKRKDFSLADKTRGGWNCCQHKIINDSFCWAGLGTIFDLMFVASARKKTQKWLEMLDERVKKFQIDLRKLSKSEAFTTVVAHSQTEKSPVDSSGLYPSRLWGQGGPSFSKEGI